MTFFELNSPAQLFRKMESDLAELVASSSDSHLAFNFFVTAEHLPDWLHQRSLVRKHALLRVVSHLANGAKHFRLDPKRHHSVDGTSIERYAEEGYADPGYFEEPLLIHLSPDEATELGQPVIEVPVLGALVLAFWRPYVPSV